MNRKKIQFSILILISMLATAVIACGSEKNDAADFEKAKNETRAEIQNAIARIDKILDTAEVRVDTLSSEAPGVYDSTVQELRQERAVLQKRLSELDQTAHDKWQEFKSEVSHDINSTYDKIRNLDSNFHNNSE
jgi:archaellum component FlaC